MSEFGEKIRSYNKKFYGTSGQELENKEYPTVAYSSSGEKTCNFFVAFYRGHVFDPHGVDGKKTNRRWEFRKTNEKTFNLYVKYLKTRNKALLTQAERNCQNG